MIEKYIQFAIDNGFKWLDRYKGMPRDIREFEWEYTITIDDDWFICEANVNLINLITSKPFIEAVARGYIVSRFTLHDDLTNSCQQGYYDDITERQAMAIRDKTLDKFIEKLLPKQ